MFLLYEMWFIYLYYFYLNPNANLNSSSLNNINIDIDLNIVQFFYVDNKMLISSKILILSLIVL